MTELWRGFENPGPIKRQEASPAGAGEGGLRRKTLHYYASRKLKGCNSLRKGGRGGGGGLAGMGVTRGI